ncbi:glycosyltransferase family 2 protein [Roseiconus lacunae]|uniref:glycosyltransferase family 2 protein n=1 Tax=Roseiconus lacunae TaxID=2605694 RepID=UPI001E4DB9CC|nr:glycosyltransferase family 2 protein [Roseiconus lacunae]MCD0458159.1 glycosyltransferase family 2 protein [Roseiconus lacunae]
MHEHKLGNSSWSDDFVHRDPARRALSLIIQIPCFNESATLPATLADLPKQVPGFSSVKVLVVDDGSSDGTAEIAGDHGADYVVVHKSNRGLARAFRTGLDTAINLGADVIVNTDGDNQYVGADVAMLVKPIVDGTAEFVIGDRQTDSVSHFSFRKKILQKVGSSIVRLLSGTEVPDAVSGFRAFSREAAIELNIISSFSYTIETVIQAGAKKIAISSVPIRTNPTTRESRLFKSIPQFVGKSVVTIVCMYAMYKPIHVFLCLGFFLTTIGSLPIIRFLYFVSIGDSEGHVQSLVLGGVFLLLGCLSCFAGLLAHLIACNRQLLELCLFKARNTELAIRNAQRHE